MPRLRAPETAAGSKPPAALLDPDSPVWRTAARAREFFDENSLPVRGRLQEATPLQRHWAAVEAWVVSMGHYRTYGDGSYKFPLYSGWADTGIPNTSSARLMEMFALAGVTIEE